MDPKFKKLIIKDWLVIIAIVVGGFTATFFFVRNADSVDSALSQWTSNMSGLGLLIEDLGRKKPPQVSSVPAGPAPAIGGLSDSHLKPFDPAELFAVQVIDGETIRLSDGTTIRLIGVDAPEAASAFIKREIEGKNIILAYEARMKDNDGRILAYVHRRADDFFLNAEIVKQGFGFTDVNTPFEKMEEFDAYEQQARVEKRGIWGEINS